MGLAVQVHRVWLPGRVMLLFVQRAGMLSANTGLYFEGNVMGYLPGSDHRAHWKAQPAHETHKRPTPWWGWKGWGSLYRRIQASATGDGHSRERLSVFITRQLPLLSAIKRVSLELLYLVCQHGNHRVTASVNRVPPQELIGNLSICCCLFFAKVRVRLTW